jgi:hypothetical protein
MYFRNFLSIALTIICLILGTGCSKQKDRERVLNAINPKTVTVTNGQAAVLRLGNGYAAIVPNYVSHDEIRYQTVVSSNGDFQSSAQVIEEGVVTTTTSLKVGDTRVFISYGGENATEVMLDFDDKQTGIALFPTNHLRLINISQIEFKQGKPLNPQDLMNAR